MGLEDVDLQDDRDVAGGGKAASPIPCSICLEDVTHYRDRAWAKLQCGHQFHLDCIGSAFNVKGVMQCPNCRKVEKGQWLYADGCRPYPELNIEDLVNDEDLYDLNYSESSMWCPYGGFARLAAAFDEVEFPTTAYHDLVRQHAVFSERATVLSSATQICPYIAYVQPIHPSTSSTTSANVSEGGPSYNNQWNNYQSAPTEMPNSYAFPTMDHPNHHHSLFPRPGEPDHPFIMPPRPAMPRSGGGSYGHPFLVGQSSGSRAPPSSVGSTMIHPYPGSAARARERSQALEAYFQQPSNLGGMVGSSSVNNVGQVGEQSRGGIYYVSATTTRSFPEADNPMLNPYHNNNNNIWERDAAYPVERGGPFQHHHHQQQQQQHQQASSYHRARHGSDGRDESLYWS